MSDYKNIDEEDEDEDEDKNVLDSIFKLSDAQRALFENDLSSFFTFTDLQRAIYENDLASPYLFPYSQIPLLENNRWAPKPIYENEPALASTVVDVGSALYGERYDLYPMPMGRIESGQNYFNPSENKKTSDVKAGANYFSCMTNMPSIGAIHADDLGKLLKLTAKNKFIFTTGMSAIDLILSGVFLNSELMSIENDPNLNKQEKASQTGGAAGKAFLGASGAIIGGVVAGPLGGYVGLLGGMLLGELLGKNIADFGYLYNQILSKDDSSLHPLLKRIKVLLRTHEYFIHRNIDSFLGSDSDRVQSSKSGSAPPGLDLNFLKPVPNVIDALEENSGQTQTDKVSPWLDLRDPFAEFYDGLTYKNLNSDLSPSIMLQLDVHNSRSNSGSIIDVIDALEKSSIQAETDKSVSPWIKLLTDLNFLKPVPNGTDNTDSLSKIDGGAPITRGYAPYSPAETETAPAPITGGSTSHSETTNSNVFIELAKGLKANRSGDALPVSVQLVRSGVF